MKIHLELLKANDKFHGKNNSGFVDSGFVKTCDELVIGHRGRCNAHGLGHPQLIPIVKLRQPRCYSCSPFEDGY